MKKWCSSPSLSTAYTANWPSFTSLGCCRPHPEQRSPLCIFDTMLLAKPRHSSMNHILTEKMLHISFSILHLLFWRHWLDTYMLRQALATDNWGQEESTWSFRVRVWFVFVASHRLVMYRCVPFSCAIFCFSWIRFNAHHACERKLVMWHQASSLLVKEKWIYSFVSIISVSTTSQEFEEGESKSQITQGVSFPFMGAGYWLLSKFLKVFFFVHIFDRNPIFWNVLGKLGWIWCLCLDSMLFSRLGISVAIYVGKDL